MTVLALDLNETDQILPDRMDYFLCLYLHTTSPTHTHAGIYIYIYLRAYVQSQLREFSSPPSNSV